MGFGLQDENDSDTKLQGRSSNSTQYFSQVSGHCWYQHNWTMWDLGGRGTERPMAQFKCRSTSRSHLTFSLIRPSVVWCFVAAWPKAPYIHVPLVSATWVAITSIHALKVLIQFFWLICRRRNGPITMPWNGNGGTTSKTALLRSGTLSRPYRARRYMWGFITNTRRGLRFDDVLLIAGQSSANT